jgi:hypothetical protein
VGAEMDEILEILRKTTTKTQNIFDEIKDSTSKQLENYENMLKSEKASEMLKLEASLMKRLDFDRLERLSAQLSLLYILQIFAFKVKILQISIANIDEQLSKSQILGKTKEIEDAKKDIDKLVILLEAQYELIRKIGDDRNKGLFYIS